MSDQEDPGWKTQGPLFAVASTDSNLTRAQKFIYEAIQAVKTGPTDDRLIDAVALLGQAQNKIVEFLKDAIPEAHQEGETA